MQEQLIKHEEQTEFHKFDLVWSKLTGYPWWPGKIVEIPKQKSGKYKVQFIGDNTHAFLPINKLISYAEGREKHSTPQKIFKGFQAAKEEADMLAANALKETEGVRGDYSQLKTVPDQQIQIFNQEASINNSAYSPPQQKQQKIQQTKEMRIIRKKSEKNQRRQKGSIMRPSAINKRKQIYKQERKVSQLLKKYHLDYIPPIDQKEQPTRRMTKRKRKIIIRKKIVEISEIDIQTNLIRKIKSILRKKNYIDSILNRKIAVYLGQQLMAKRAEGIRGAHQALFQWLSANDIHAIERSYRNWYSCPDKLVTGFTDSYSVRDMREIDEE